MEEVSRNVREAADSARAAAAEWVAALQDQADYATAVEAGGRLPPQVAAAVCNLCDEEMTGNCKKGNCASCCQSNRGPGPFACCPGGYGSSGDGSSAEAREALDMQQAVDVEQVVDVEHATDVEQAEDVENAAVFQEVHQVSQEMQQDVDSRRQRIEPWYYGPQPGQRAAGVSAGGSRRQRAPSQAAGQGSGSTQAAVQTASSSKQAKARQNMAGVDTGGGRVAKSRRTSELSVERLELGNVLVGAALQQADSWVQQWDRLVGRGNSGHLRVSTPARSSEKKWRQGVRARQQLMDNGHTVWQEAEWVSLILQQYGNLTGGKYILFLTSYET